MPDRPLHLFTIEPGDPFLPRLAKSLLNGTLVAGIDRSIGPLALADVTILVPTRRAARALRTIIAAQLGGSGALLPDIRPLGEFEDDVFDVLEEGAILSLPAIGAFQRILELAPLVEKWRSLILQADTKRIFADEAIVLPASRADAIWLARELAALIDEAATEGANWKNLLKLEETRDLADWWKLTNQFLNIITAVWPDVLAEKGLTDPSTHRRKMIENYKLQLETRHQDKVVIAAGSTGSIPATAMLLKTIAAMPRGAVVLPGLDRGRFSNDLIAGLYPASGDASAIGHPQYGLAKLLFGMKAKLLDVKPLGKVDAMLDERRHLVSLALLPASSTHLWAGQSFEPGVLNGVTLIEAANEREEALAIAVALRQAIEAPGVTAALVTPDRTLARRVATELKRFHIEANDSGGMALTATMPGSFLMRLVEALYGDGDPLAILALLKHPLFCCEKPRAEMRDLAETFELYVLRGRSGRPKLGALAQELADAHIYHGKKGFQHNALKMVTAEDLAKLAEFAAAFDAQVTPCVFEGEKQLSDILIAVVTLLEYAATNNDGSFAKLYSEESGAGLASALRSLIEAGGNFAANLREVPDILRALLSGETVKPRPGGHSRVFIWGTLEARLQTVDTVVLGGLNEGTWPSVPESGPFLSRLMQQEIALEPPERRIGQAAHDFEQLMGLKTVIISRALRSEGAPSEPARWLQRLSVVAGKTETNAIKQRGEDILELTRRIDVSASQDLVKRPEPKPPFNKRPVHFYVTEIETLRRDPYAIYARKVLQLQPLDSLIADPGPRERGILFHAILHEATRRNLDYRAEFAAKALIEIANDGFGEAHLPADITALWWPRFLAMVDDLVDFETQRQQASIIRYSELSSSKLLVGKTGVTLSARADRVDVMDGQEAVVMDYKTGATPSISDARALHAPQLALEVALLARGAFSNLGQLNVSEALFIRLGNRGVVKIETLGSKTKAPLDLAQEAWERLEKLLFVYTNQERGYISRAFAPKQNTATARDAPYDHLARVFEWSATGNEGDDDSSEAEL